MKLFLDMDGTIARFNVRNALERFEIEKDFFENLLPYKNVDTLEYLNIDIYIISASPNKQADNSKMIWLNKYMNYLPKENITICRVGENKAEIIKSKYNIDLSECYLLDDYTKNLVEWETNGGIGLKRITKCADNSTKKWKGAEIKDLTELFTLFGVK